jgi:hypothetical protein
MLCGFRLGDRKDHKRYGDLDIQLKCRQDANRNINRQKNSAMTSSPISKKGWLVEVGRASLSSSLLREIVEVTAISARFRVEMARISPTRRLSGRGRDIRTFGTTRWAVRPYSCVSSGGSATQSILRDCVLVRQSCQTSAVWHDFAQRIPGDSVAESGHESTPVLEEQIGLDDCAPGGHTRSNFSPAGSVVLLLGTNGHQNSLVSERIFDRVLQAVGVVQR